jgi:hypothetical protein
MGNLRSRSIRSLPGETTSHAQSGASSRNGVAGTAGSRDRNHPARSGTRMSRARCSSGSKRMIRPPGPPRPMESATQVHAEHGCSFGVRPRRSRARVQIAVQHLRHDVVRRLEHVVVARVASCGLSCHRRDFITRTPFGRAVRSQSPSSSSSAHRVTSPRPEELAIALRAQFRSLRMARVERGPCHLG